MSIYLYLPHNNTTSHPNMRKTVLLVLVLQRMTDEIPIKAQKLNKQTKAVAKNKWTFVCLAVSELIYL